MPIDKSYKVWHYVYLCEHCGRKFDSGGNWASGAVKMCEEECAKAAERGEVRVFLPPPGRWDTMFCDKQWRFVKKGSPEETCSKEGHIEERRWELGYRAHHYDEEGNRLDIENEHVACTRCGISVCEFQGRTRDKPREESTP